jgi:hypothetical protein
MRGTARVRNRRARRPGEAVHSGNAQPTVGVEKDQPHQPNPPRPASKNSGAVQVNLCFWERILMYKRIMIAVCFTAACLLLTVGPGLVAPQPLA